MASILGASHCKNVRLISLLTRSHKESERGQFENFVRQSRLSRKRVYQQCFVNANTAAAAMALSAISPEKKPRKNRLANEQRDRSWWANGYVNWTDKQFKKRFGLNKITFDFFPTAG